MEGNHLETDSFPPDDRATTDYRCTHIKEEPASPEVNLPCTEDTSDECDPACSSPLETNENAVHSASDESPQVSQDPDAIFNGLEYPMSTNSNSKGESQLGNVIIHDADPLVREHSREEKLFPCPECGRCFRAARRLVWHRRTHSGEKPYKCAECGKCFSLKQNLIGHQSIHTREKRFKCSECGKCFSHNQGLSKHRKIHRGERPFECPQYPPNRSGFKDPREENGSQSWCSGPPVLKGYPGLKTGRGLTRLATPPPPSHFILLIRVKPTHRIGCDLLQYVM
uniref:C2H2-type domain-containing protein n=1 Tax=Leptobrachium leishanense TaxID=445787 RepID=A0A8C5MD12_9ANUR